MFGDNQEVGRGQCGNDLGLSADIGEHRGIPLGGLYNRRGTVSRRRKYAREMVARGRESKKA
jgi:hypothetical protein